MAGLHTDNGVTGLLFFLKYVVKMDQFLECLEIKRFYPNRLTLLSDNSLIPMELVIS